jgi:hypothetical protein
LGYVAGRDTHVAIAAIGIRQTLDGHGHAVGGVESHVGEKQANPLVLVLADLQAGFLTRHRLVGGASDLVGTLTVSGTKGSAVADLSFATKTPLA